MGDALAQLDHRFDTGPVIDFMNTRLASSSSSTVRSQLLSTAAHKTDMSGCTASPSSTPFAVIDTTQKTIME